MKTFTKTAFIKKLFITLTGFLLIIYSEAQNKYFRSITLDHTKVPNTNLLNFPVLISGIYPYLKTMGNGGKVRNANGYDILFTTDSTGTTKLNWEIERYNPLTGELVAWVKTDLSPTTDKTIFLLYGDSTISSFQGNIAGTWNSAYASVYHLKDGVTLNAGDATSNSNNGIIAGATATAGQIAGGTSLSGNSQYINIGNGSSLGITGNLTIEAWINPTDFSNYNGIVGKVASYLPKPYDFYLLQGTGIPQLYRGNGTLSGYSNVAGSAAPAAGVWSHIVVTASGTTVTHYLNGSTNGSGTLTAASAPVNGTDNVYIGTRSDFVTMFKGKMDEVRISNVALTADWIKTEYNNQSSPSTFYSVGTEKVVGNQSPVANAGPNQTIILPTSSVT